MPQISHPSFSHMNAKKPTQDPSKAPTRPFPPKKAAEREIPVYTVEPPEDEQARFEAQMQAQAAQMQQQAIQTPTEPIQAPISNGLPGLLDDAALKANMDKKKVFDKLILFREDHITEVDVAGLKFRLKLLNANDNAYVLKQMKQVPSDEQMSKLSIMVLSAAIVDVNGVKLEDAYNGPKEITDPVMQRYFELNSWHAPIINVLSAAYSKFQASVEKEYTAGFLGK